MTLRDVEQVAPTLANDYESYGDNICQPSLTISDSTEFAIAVWNIANSGQSVSGWSGSVEDRDTQYNATYHHLAPSAGTLNCTMTASPGSVRGPGAAAAFTYEEPPSEGEVPFWM
jgi:hypothetical protein